MAHFLLRPARMEDAAGIAFVHYHGWMDTYRGIIHDEYLDSLSLQDKTVWWNKVLSPGVQRGFTEIMVNEENKVIGFASGGKRPHEGLNTEGELMALYLLTDYHGKGLGKSLFIKSAERLREQGSSSFCVFVLMDNPAFHFYKKFNPDNSVVKHQIIGDKPYEETGFAWRNIDALLSPHSNIA